MNPDRGFLEAFAPAFLERYASEPHFLGTVSDIFTLALVEIYRKNNLLQSESTIARFSSDAAVQALRLLVRRTESKDMLFGAAMRADPPEAFERRVDTVLGSGFFSRWIVALEGRDYERATALLDAIGSP